MEAREEREKWSQGWKVIAEEIHLRPAAETSGEFRTDIELNRKDSKDSLFLVGGAVKIVFNNGFLVKKLWVRILLADIRLLISYF